MPCKIVAITVTVALLSGCSTFSPVPVIEQPYPAAVATVPLQEWLNLRQETSKLTSGEASALLAEITEPKTPKDWFYKGLLLQEQQQYDVWTQARDTFRLLAQSDALAPELQQLAALLETFNQNRINWYQRHNKLQVSNEQLRQQLLVSQQEKQLLEQKIQALTDLEEAISTRREQ